MVTNIMEKLAKIILFKEMESINLRMVLSIQGNSKIINFMDMENLLINFKI